ncbi:hypothetical protein Tco_0044075 [Tanacetum coccineum]
MNYVIDQSPWLVNIPLEAWSVRGISALASRLGRPIKMDQVTTDMLITNSRTNAGNMNRGVNREGFVEVKNRKNYNNNKRMWNNDFQGNKQQQAGVKLAFITRESNEKPMIDKQRKIEHVEGSSGVSTTPKVWNVGQDNVK